MIDNIVVPRLYLLESAVVGDFLAFTLVFFLLFSPLVKKGGVLCLALANS
jgi:hypothetical protein